jgi:transcriptional regulator with XRE-family HTH domain
MNIDSSLVAELRDKTYRDAYVASQIRMTLPIQIRRLRVALDLTQPELAERAGMAQPRISELEKPGERRLTIETLLRIAAAFDVGLQVRFVPFNELIDWSEGLDTDNFRIAPFNEEIEQAERDAVLTLQQSKKPPGRITSAESASGGGSTQGPKRFADLPEPPFGAFQQESQSGGKNAAFGNIAG